ncbi:uncharacterized protein LOC113333755 isoform X2 [Papaver somniferum]|uniref:uncharacterized protein LOC113333755 isoform X2 n=1 Tax=Papaver somniferum TaxID=3469 RepID=UPI000E7038A2|nr:uncharacterized protein LOC113333755 isoform X2 [Papaver somniferum]
MVDWDMNKDRPCGKNQAKYSGVIVLLLKQSRRWNWENPWNLQDDNAKDWLWAELKDLFAVDECHKQGTLSIVGGIFKDKKGKWKRKHYKLTNTHAMNLKDKPNPLTEGQWKSLVKLWDSEAHQTLSKKNAISRSQQKTKHTMGRKNYSRCEAEMAQENGGNPPTDGDVFIKTHINKVSGKALDPFSQGYIAQLREQSGLDENGLDEDGNQQSISNEVYANVVPTKRHKRIRAQRYHLEYSRNEDFEREKEEREEEFKRQMKERDAEWERRMEAQNDQYNVRQNQMMEYVRLCRPDLFTRSGQLSGSSHHLFRTGEHHHRPWEQLSIHGPTPFIPLEQRRRPCEQPGIPEEQLFGPSPRYRSGEQPSRHGPTNFIPLEQRQRPVEHPGRPEEQLFGHAEPLYRSGEHPNRHGATTFIPLEQRQRPGEQPGRTEELLFGPAEPLYISRDQLNRPQNDCKSHFLDNKGTQGTGTDVWDWISRPSES